MANSATYDPFGSGAILADDPQRMKRSPLRCMLYSCVGCFASVWVVCCLIGGLAWLASRSEATETSNYSFEVVESDEPITLDIRLVSGDISIIGSEEATTVDVEIEHVARSYSKGAAQKGLKNANVTVDNQLEDNSTVKIEADNEVQFEGIAPIFLDTSITITVPMNVALNFEVTNGSVEVESLAIGAATNITTDNGDITLTDLTSSATLSLSSNNGRLKIDGLNTEAGFFADIENGNFDLDNIVLSDGAELTTANGDIDFAGTLEGTASLRYLFETKNGDITLVFDTTLPLDLNASTENGEITNDLELTNVVRNTDDTLVGCYPAATGETLGDNRKSECGDAPQVEIRTDNGDISIKHP